MLGYLFYGENAWISELDWGAIKNDLREIKESLLARAVAFLQGLQQDLARAEGREAAAGAGENIAEAQALTTPAAGEALEGQTPAVTAPLDPIATPPQALQLSASPVDTENSWEPEEGTLAEARAEGLLNAWQNFWEASSGPSDLFRKFLDDILRQGYPSWETIKEINDAKINFAHNCMTIDIALQEAIDAFIKGLHTADKLEELGYAPDAAKLRSELWGGLGLALVASTRGGLGKEDVLNSIRGAGKNSEALLKGAKATEKPAAAATKGVKATEKAVAVVKGATATRVETVVKAKSKVWEKLQPYKGKFRTNGEKGAKLRYHKWDYTHNDIEIYDGNWNHLGSIDPVTGEPYKPGKPNRKEGF